MAALCGGYQVGDVVYSTVKFQHKSKKIVQHGSRAIVQGPSIPFYPDHVSVHFVATNLTVNMNVAHFEAKSLPGLFQPGEEVFSRVIYALGGGGGGLFSKKQPSVMLPVGSKAVVEGACEPYDPDYLMVRFSSNGARFKARADELELRPIPGQYLVGDEVVTKRMKSEVLQNEPHIAIPSSIMSSFVLFI